MDIDDEPGTPPPGIAPRPWSMHAAMTSEPTGSWGNTTSEGTGESTNKKKKTDKHIVTEPTLDLEAYIGNYTGHTKIDRLWFIADRCPPLAVDALKMALEALKTTSNTLKYHQVHQKLTDILAYHHQPLPSFDTRWYEETTSASNAKRNRLEQELKTYKNNLIKESIRMGHNDLGDYYYDIGDLNSALKSYSRTRDYCTTSKHIIDMCLNVIKVSIELSNMAQVQTHFLKAEQTPEIPDRNIVMGKLNCAMALAQLDVGKYKQAARRFLEVSFEMANHYNDVISPNDIAYYGALCALASFDRSELKKHVFENSEFKLYLELEPQVRELLHSFYNSKYHRCLNLMQTMKNDLLLDMHLHSHVEALFQSIRKRALVQYFSPFLSVDINKMAAAFNTSVAHLEAELASLIRENEIQGRIDSHNKILKVKSADQRSQIFEKSLKMGTDYKKQAHFALLRMKLMQNNLIVRAPDERER
ncbi:cop9 signalosome complex subunit [Rhizophlyctis rosea]|nr:cop9 signalosome complex subunit [Rhizophlyctis rosea]